MLETSCRETLLSLPIRAGPEEAGEEEGYKQWEQGIRKP